jgi:hypothetical protein
MRNINGKTVSFYSDVTYLLNGGEAELDKFVKTWTTRVEKDPSADEILKATNNQPPHAAPALKSKPWWKRLIGHESFADLSENRRTRIEQLYEQAAGKHVPQDRAPNGTTYGSNRERIESIKKGPNLWLKFKAKDVAKTFLHEEGPNVNDDDLDKWLYSFAKKHGLGERNPDWEEQLTLELKKLGAKYITL